MAVKESTVVTPTPADVKSSVPRELKLAPEAVAALGGDVAAVAPVAPAVEPPVIPAAAPMQQSTTTTTTTAPPPVTVTKGENLTLTPTTTAAEDEVTKGQRHINRVWEYSQAAIALLITLAIVYCAVNRISSQDLTNSFFLIVGFYFSRVNHQAIGGTGPKPQEGPYQGR